MAFNPLYCPICWHEIGGFAEPPSFCPECEQKVVWTSMRPHKSQADKFSQYDRHFLRSMKISTD